MKCHRKAHPPCSLAAAHGRLSFPCIPDFAALAHPLLPPSSRASSSDFGMPYCSHKAGHTQLQQGIQEIQGRDYFDTEIERDGGLKATAIGWHS